MSRGPYKFSAELKRERRAGVESTCEMCGKYVTNGEVHHLVGAYLSSQNPMLAPHIIKSLENEAYLCKNCHAKANEDQHRWKPKDIGFMAWALFDLDPIEVAAAQIRTYDSGRMSSNQERRMSKADQKRQSRAKRKRRKNKEMLRRRQSGRSNRNRRN